MIKLQGSKIRYLSPQLRSAASLIDKAFHRKNLDFNFKDSTPGIISRKITKEYLISVIKEHQIIEIKSSSNSYNKKLSHAYCLFFGNIKSDLELEKHILESLSLPFDVIDATIYVAAGVQ